MGQTASQEPKPSGIAAVVDRNICALLDRRKAEDRSLSWREKVADRVTAFSGSMTFVFLHLVIVTAWVLINIGWVPGVPKFDPTFVILASAASVEAIFLSTFILITQNRMMAAADKRADLNLQISLLAEHEITRLIQMVRALGDKLNVPEIQQADLDELAKDIPPEKVLDRIERHEERVFPGKAGEAN